MAAHIGNKFWELRLKHGRNSKIETPEQLWENFIEYAEYCHNNPLIEIDYRGKDAVQVEVPKMSAMTKGGFALACGYSKWDDIVYYKDEFKPHFKLIKKAIEDLGWVGETADRRANDTCFVFSDKTALGFSWRAWGDLMSAIVGKNEGYMAYYM